MGAPASLARSAAQAKHAPHTPASHTCSVGQQEQSCISGFPDFRVQPEQHAHSKARCLPARIRTGAQAWGATQFFFFWIQEFS